MKKIRRCSGNAIAETGPALYLFIFIIFFPMLDVLGYALQYGCGWYYNHMMIEELSVRTMAEGTGGQVKTEVDQKFMGTGIPKFLRVPATGLTMTTPVYDNTQNPPLVSCKTTVTGLPFIPMPMFGFTQSTFTFGAEAVRENQR